ncbi:MAG: DMT family transporter [Marivibrio sp.]|uniref:DMT family transporter n=1 Tax=Marivibrio sp. TaxID=2039719 RepID=UPI0032EC7E06
MTGELFALVSAACFGLAGAAIAKGASNAQGDNGAFLSVILTMAFAAAVWAATGPQAGWPDSGAALAAGIGFFVASGMLATVFGRLTNFKTVALAGAIRASLLRRLIPVFSTILAFVLLGERYELVALAGMALILGSVALTLRERAPALTAAGEQISSSRLRLGALVGIVCALCYASAYVARKLAMDHVPDAAFGALVGAATGIVWYGLAAPFSARYRDSVAGVFRTAGRWQWIAAASMSLGQVLLFFALKHAEVAVVAIIGTTEIFVGLYLAAFLFKTEPPPGRFLIAATALATLGVVLVALA